MPHPETGRILTLRDSEFAIHIDKGITIGACRLRNHLSDEYRVTAGIVKFRQSAIKATDRFDETWRPRN